MTLSRSDRLRQKALLFTEVAMIISRNSDIRWLTGFSGSNGAVLITNSEVHVFTDGRYTEQVARETVGCLTHIDQGNAVSNAAKYAHGIGIRGLQIQWEDLSHAAVQKLTREFPELKLEDFKYKIDRFRGVKEDFEQDTILRALRITEQALSDCLPMVQEGMSELALAAEIDYTQRKLGAEKSSFETIVAFGAQTALPHARPGNNKLKRGEPILLDFGCVVDGYASDMTRMVHYGPPSPEFINTYEIVLQALNKATACAQAGITGKELDDAARRLFRKEGLESFFSHSLGHGVGLDIHEWPAVSSRNEEELPLGSVITLEPGLYFPGQYGIRIENMVRLDSVGCTTLNTLTTNLIVL